jgi:hypothetical protein
MHGKQSALLGQLVSAADGWRTTGASVGVVITQVNAILPDNRPVTLSYDTEANDWLVTTS